MDGIRYRVLPLEVDPNREIHDSLGHFLDVEVVQRCAADDHLQLHTVQRHFRDFRVQPINKISVPLLQQTVAFVENEKSNGACGDEDEERQEG